MRERLNYSINYELILKHKNTESCCHMSRSFSWFYSISVGASTLSLPHICRTRLKLRVVTCLKLGTTFEECRDYAGNEVDKIMVYEVLLHSVIPG